MKEPCFKAQIALDDRFEQYKPADNFSNFALHLAAMYKASDMSQSTIAGYFNQMYDLAQGKKAATLFDEADTTKYPLAEIIKKILNIEYQPAKNGNNNVTNGGADVALLNQVGQGGQLRGNEPPASGEQTPTGTEPSDRGTGTESDSGQGSEVNPNRRGHKQIERAKRDLTAAMAEGDAKAVSIAIAKFRSNVDKGAEATAEEKDIFDKAVAWLADQGYEYVEQTGKPYNPGMRCDADFITDETLPTGTQIIYSVLEPLLLKDGKMVQRPKYVVRQSVYQDKEEEEQDKANAPVNATQAAIAQAEAETDTNPTEKQKKYDRTVPATLEAKRSAIKRIVDYAKDVKDRVERAVIGGITDRQKADFAKKNIDVDESFVHSIDNSAIIHNQNQHGNPKEEDSLGQIAITEEDYARIPDILENYDTVDKSPNKSRSTQNEVIIYQKEYEDGYVYYLEEKRDKRKSLAFQTMYKKKKGTDSSDGLLPDATPSTPVAPSDNLSSNSDGKDNTLSTEEQISSSQSSEATSSMTDEKVATQPTDSESVELEQPSVQVSVQAASAEVNTTPTPGLDEDYRRLSLNEKKERISDVAQSIELSTGGRVKSHVVTTIADLREAMGDSEDVNTAEWIEDDFVSGDVVAVHSVNSGKIYIFATKMPGKLRTITQIYHEGGHVALARVSDKENLLGTVVDEIERLMPKLASKVRNGYQSYFDRKFPDESDEAKEQVIKEEILVESIAHHIARGTIEDLLGRMSEISRDACITYLEEIGYGRNGQKNITRRQGLNGRVGDDRSTGLGRLEEEYGSHGRTQRKDEDDGYTPDKLSDEAVEDEIGKPINNTKASDDNTLQKDKRDIDVQNSTHVDVKTQQYKLAQKREQEASQAYSEAHRAYQEAGVKWCRKEGIDPHGNHSQEEINSIFERFNNTPEGARLNEARKKAIVAYNRAMAETMIWNIARAFKNLTFNDAKASWDNHNPRYDIEKSIGVDGERVDERKRRIGEAVTELLKDAGIEVVTDAKTVKAEYEKITGEKLADEVDEMLKGLDEKENPGLSSEQLQTQKTKLTGRNSATKVEINSSNIASIRSKLTDLKNKVTNGEFEAETFLYCCPIKLFEVIKD